MKHYLARVGLSLLLGLPFLLFAQLTARDVSLDLVWAAPPQPVEGYRVYWWIGEGVSDVPIGTVQTATTNATIKVPIGQTTTFAVTAFRGALESDLSNTATYRALSSPTGLVIRQTTAVFSQ